MRPNETKVCRIIPLFLVTIQSAVWSLLSLFVVCLWIIEMLVVLGMHCKGGPAGRPYSVLKNGLTTDSHMHQWILILPHVAASLSAGSTDRKASTPSVYRVLISSSLRVLFQTETSSIAPV